MFLYHGRNTTVNKPSLIVQTRGLDFGPGFYLTTNEEQAVRFSGIVVKRKKEGSAIVNVYTFDIAAAEKTRRQRCGGLATPSFMICLKKS